VFAKIANGFDQTVRGIGGALVITIFLSSFADVTNRIITRASIPWSHTLSIWCQIIYTFLLVGPLIWEGVHINVDLIIKRLRGWASIISYTVFAIVMIAFSIISAYSAFMYLPVLIRFNFTAQIGMWFIPFWPIIAASVAGGMLIAIPYSIAYLIRHIRHTLRVRRGEEEAEIEEMLTDEDKAMLEKVTEEVGEGKE
jgi:TRAP-type C4-dicarboxylate transport system permease small subunit